MDVSRPWLNLYPDTIPRTINYENRPLQDFLKDAASLNPTNSVIHFLGKDISYNDVYVQSLKLGNYLKDIGLKKGDRVAIMLPNCPQAVIGYYGVLFAGGIVVQTNPLYMEKELEYQLNDSGATIMITLDLLHERVQKVKPLTKLKHVIVTSIKEYLPFPKNILYPFVQKKQNGTSIKIEQSATIHLLPQILKNAYANDIEIEVDPANDIALLQYTGGTTGFSKGVMLTHRNLVANTAMCMKWMYKCREGQETILGILPFFHVYGMTAVMNLSIMQKSKMILLPKFNAEETLKTIQKLRPTLFPGAPTIYIALLNHPDINKYDLSSINICISGSAPLPKEVQVKFELVTGGKLVEGYGLSEASPITHANFLWDSEYVKGSIGVPWPDTDATIFSAETGEPAEVNEIGELAIKGPQVMKGYWKKSEETANVFREGWLLTGDLGYMDEDGYFYIVDRKKDMIIAGGYNIYPREIEEVLYECNKIQEVVVAGIPDPYRGETVKAYVVLKQGETCTSEELDQYARKYLAAYKVPKVYEFRNELPKTAVGKILRRTLVDEEKTKRSN